MMRVLAVAVNRTAISEWLKTVRCSPSVKFVTLVAPSLAAAHAVSGVWFDLMVEVEPVSEDVRNYLHSRVLSPKPKE